MKNNGIRFYNVTARSNLRAVLPFSRSRRLLILLTVAISVFALVVSTAAAGPKKKPKPKPKPETETKAKPKASEVRRKADNPIMFSGDENTERSIGYIDRSDEGEQEEETEESESQVAPMASTSTVGGSFVGLDFNRRFDAGAAVNAYVAETENGLADMIEAKQKIGELLAGAKRQNLVVTINLLQSNIDAIDEIQSVAKRYADELKKMVEDKKSRREIYFKLRNFRNVHTRAIMLRSEAMDFYERSTGREFIEVEYMGEAKNYTAHESVDASDIEDESLVLGNDTIELPESETDDEEE